MTSTRRVTSIVLVAFLTFVGFQNCSKVNFAPMDDSLTGKAGLGDGLEDVNFPENEDLDTELEDDIPADDVVDNEDGNESACELFAAGASSADAISGVNVRIRKFRGNLEVGSSETLELSNIRGSVSARTGGAKHLRNMRGSLCLVADSLDYLNNHRGNIEIIGSASDTINNTRGTLVINGGTVALINNHRGNIILKGGAVVIAINNHRGDVINQNEIVVAAE